MPIKQYIIFWNFSIKKVTTSGLFKSIPIDIFQSPIICHWIVSDQMHLYSHHNKSNVFHYLFALYNLKSTTEKEKTSKSQT